jgi:hypothetical protein
MEHPGDEREEREWSLRRIRLVNFLSYSLPPSLTSLRLVTAIKGGEA